MNNPADPLGNIPPNRRWIVEELIRPRTTRSKGAMALVVFMIAVVGPGASLGLAVLLQFLITTFFGRLPQALVLLPLLPAFIACEGAAFWLTQRLLASSRLWRPSIRAELHRLGLCTECGYDLSGNSSGTCPECGHFGEPAKIEHEPGKALSNPPRRRRPTASGFARRGSPAVSALSALGRYNPTFAISSRSARRLEFASRSFDTYVSHSAASPVSWWSFRSFFRCLQASR